MRKDVEILAPCGSFEALEAAIEAGADAVYLGGSHFGARAFADNFNNEKMKEAVRLAHSYDVKLYVTVNTLIYNNEFDSFLEYTDYLYEIGVDALIIQDIGIFRVLRNRYPDMDLHASTQMHLHNLEGVKELVEAGAQRVVLSRECTLETIKEVHEAYPDLELEIFCYGALCISYSGQCLFSSMVGGRSGNRGECAQACRLPYQLYDKDEEEIVETKGQFLLSPKDQNALSFVDQMIESGVYSFKIEGRMKRPEYVYTSVAAFRKAVDAAQRHEKFVVTPELINDLKKVFNRGFTMGHMKGSKGSDLMSQIRPNHVGVPLGKVVGIDRKTNRAAIELSDDVKQGDGIRILMKSKDEGFTLNFIYKHGLLVSSAAKGETIEIDLRDMKLAVGAMVRKTTDIELMKEIEKDIASKQRHIPISMTLYLHKNEKIRLTASYENVVAEVESESVCDVALKRPIDEERAKEQMSKLKDTPFMLQNFTFDSDHESITAISTLNELRRSVTSKLVDAIVKNGERTLKLTKELSYVHNLPTDGPKFSVAVYSEDQLRAALDMKMPLIFVRDEDLYTKYKDEPAVVLASRRVKPNHLLYNVDALLCCEMGAINEMEGKSMYVDSWMNIVNDEAIQFYANKGAKRITLSEEMTLGALYNINKENLPLEVIVYGRSELMCLRHCVINANTVDTKDINCGMCRDHEYELIDRKGEHLPIIGDAHCFNHILHCRVTVAQSLMKDLEDMGIPYYRLNFTKESYDETFKILHGFVYGSSIDVANGWLGYLGK